MQLFQFMPADPIYGGLRDEVDASGLYGFILYVNYTRRSFATYPGLLHTSKISLIYISIHHTYTR